ncbi:MAG: ATP-binding protein, partial [Ignavibacteria bacterium]|nr:ATP-binding protein [Ignavibacteria bacterium]
MKNVVGNPARGESFYQRKREVDKIIERIYNGNNLQIAAPRRIGKTSILYYLLDNKLEDYIYVYVDTEAVIDENEFYKKLLKEIIKTDEFKKSGWFQNLMQKGNKFLSKIKSVKIMGQEIDFDEAEIISDYKNEVENLLAGLEFENKQKLILLIDEFPQTIQNIVDANNGNSEKAIHFLQSNREIRLNPDINLKVTFIYTGSIGLNHTVSAIKGSAFINDLNSIEVE